MAPPLKTCRWASQELISSVHDIPGLSSATSDRLTQYAWLVSAWRNVRTFRQFRPKSMAKSLKIPLKSMKIRCWMIICIHLSYENLTFGYFWHQTWYHILATAVFSGYLLFVAVTHGNALQHWGWIEACWPILVLLAVRLRHRNLWTKAALFATKRLQSASLRAKCKTGHQGGI